jgi:hemerythrin-like domain-containing protein
MLRDKNLIPLSRQHQHALALCVRIDRAQPVPTSELSAWQEEIEQQFEQEIKIHFAAEEQVLFPAAREFPELTPLVEELIADHAALRKLFFQAEERCMSSESLLAFGQRLSNHIRKEERQLFERLQQLTNQEELAALGVELEAVLKDAAQSCIVRNEDNEVTKLKARG